MENPKPFGPLKIVKVHLDRRGSGEGKHPSWCSGTELCPEKGW
jgi:hypothetical protein